VIGAGPAGSAAAVAALRARPAARVLLLDRAPIGRDKVCGDGIAPQTVAELAALGIDAVRPEEAVPAIRLTAPGDASAIAPGGGWVVPRAEFDARLVRAAVALGARYVEERVTAVRQDSGGVTVNGHYRAPIAVGADGSNSVARRLVGEHGNSGPALAVAVRGYAPAPPGAPRELLIRWDAGRGGLSYGWAFPTADGRMNVGYGAPSGIPGGRAALEAAARRLLPEFDLDGVRLTGHTLPLSVARPRPAIGRVLLAGDAASLVNPLTGEGIHSAVVSGALAGEVAALDPRRAGRRYQRGLARRFGRQHRQVARLHPLLDSPAVLAAALRACATRPRLFARLIDVGLGDGAFPAWAWPLLVRRLARIAAGQHALPPTRTPKATA
jgi:menaquinone-9 beta-reductase